MPVEKLEWYKKEMPWIPKFLEKEREKDKDRKLKHGFEVDQIYVQRPDPSFLDYRPITAKRREHVFDGRTVYYSDYPVGESSKADCEIMYFVDRDGNIVTYEVGFTVPPEKFLFFTTKQEVRKLETWSAVLSGSSYRESLPVSHTVDCIGERAAAYINYIVSYFSYTKALIVYRPPNGRMLAEWLAQERQAYISKLLEKTRVEVLESCVS